LEESVERIAALDNLVSELKDHNAALEDNNAERDSLRSRAAEQAESVVNASDRLEESVDSIAALDNLVSELKDQNAALEDSDAERDSLRSQAAEHAESVVNASSE
jgi:FtsZ-binding cell division protein ZapB